MRAKLCASMGVMRGLSFVPEWESRGLTFVPHWEQWCNLQRVLGRMRGRVGKGRGEWSLLDVLPTNGKVLMTLVMAGR